MRLPRGGRARTGPSPLWGRMLRPEDMLAGRPRMPDGRKAVRLVPSPRPPLLPRNAAARSPDPGGIAFPVRRRAFRCMSPRLLTFGPRSRRHGPGPVALSPVRRVPPPVRVIRPGRAPGPPRTVPWPRSATDIDQDFLTIPTGVGPSGRNPSRAADPGAAARRSRTSGRLRQRAPGVPWRLRGKPALITEEGISFQT
jgi:hypothetical protein